MKNTELFITISYTEIHLIPQFRWVNGVAGFNTSLTVLNLTITFDFDK